MLYESFEYFLEPGGPPSFAASASPGPNFEIYQNFDFLTFFAFFG